MPGAGRSADSCAFAHLWRQVHETHLAAPEPSREPDGGSPAAYALPPHQLAAVDVQRRLSSGSLASWRDAKEELPTSSGSSSPGLGPQQLDVSRTTLTSLLLQQHAPTLAPAADTLSSESGSPLSQRQYSGSIDASAAAALMPAHSDRAGLAAGTLGGAAGAMGSALAAAASSAWAAGFDPARRQMAAAPALAGPAAGAPATDADGSRALLADPAGTVADVAAAADGKGAEHVPAGAPAEASSAGAPLAAPPTQNAAAHARSSSSGAPLEAAAAASAGREGEAGKSEKSSGQGGGDGAEAAAAAVEASVPAAAHADGGLEEAISRAQAALASVRSFSGTASPQSPGGLSPLAVTAGQRAAGSISPAGPALPSFDVQPAPRPQSPPGLQPAPRRTFPTFPIFPSFSRKAEPHSPPELAAALVEAPPSPAASAPIAAEPKSPESPALQPAAPSPHLWQPSPPAPQPLPSAASPAPSREAAGRESSSSPASERQYPAPVTPVQVALHHSLPSPQQPPSPGLPQEAVAAPAAPASPQHPPSPVLPQEAAAAPPAPAEPAAAAAPGAHAAVPPAPEQSAAAASLQPQDASSTPSSPRDAESDAEARDSAAASPFSSGGSAEAGGASGSPEGRPPSPPSELRQLAAEEGPRQGFFGREPGAPCHGGRGAAAPLRTPAASFPSPSRSLSRHEINEMTGCGGVLDAPNPNDRLPWRVHCLAAPVQAAQR